jgi:hypothetical protein
MMLWPDKSPDPRALTALCSQSNMFPPNHFRVPPTSFFRIRSDILIYEPRAHATHL